MKKYGFSVFCLISFAVFAFADTIPVKNFVHYGPYPVPDGITIGSDSADIMYKQNWTTVLSQNTATRKDSPQKINYGKIVSGGDTPELHSISFDIQADRFSPVKIDVKGTDKYKIAVNGKQSANELTLTPATYAVSINYFTEENSKDTIQVDLVTERPEFVSVRSDGKRNYTIEDVIYGQQIGGISISPDGKWLITDYTLNLPGNDSRSWQILENIATGATSVFNGPRIGWMPRSSRYFFEQKGLDGRELIVVDPVTGQREKLAINLPQGRYIISPDEKTLFFYVFKEGKKEDPDIYQILEPEDRQPGWRNRYHIARYDIPTGVYQPLTDGHLSARPMDISDDGKKMLLSVSRSRLEHRPTTVTDLLLLDLNTMKIDTIVSRDGFIGRSVFSPDASKILISGSPEALGGIGKNVPEGRMPSMVDTQLFIYDVATRATKPLTKEFNPNIGYYEWSRADGMVYFTAEDKDYINLFRLNPANGKIERIPVPEDNISAFSLPVYGTNAAMKGQSVSNPDRLYVLDTKTMKSRKIAEPKAAQLADVKLGECKPWTFVNSRGDSINGRFFLPPDFDPSKKYPLIVNYYGGCSPTERVFESRYPHNAYAALGYVVYVINPSGATGFGQEFSSRHVNTAGQGVADDIIEGTKLFCQTHPFVDETKIGCIGASYGGFMTQYLQTVTDLFAAAISHAGISDHTSYWGNGYWGYSYSEVSMADSYPWSDTELYVQQSPLYRADKIHTPILFLHGDSDHNVPFAESIQLFTALKLLGRETALVAVSNQDHHILDPVKRLKWQNTIWAWFAKYLQDDPTWWDNLYPPTAL